ncbi:glycosyltransferase [Nonlabens sp.]|uniref:glycosyltransferase family 2 protein n=1 Tax=Nonlabens sp. TaxID=1888209 RepID=UPI001BCE0224|nr:glycosyltransferase [Nonlabens sp.]
MVFIEYINNKISSSLYKGAPVILAIEKIAKNQPDQTLLIYRKGVDAVSFQKAASSMLKPHIIVSSCTLLHEDLGYVEDSPFIAVSSSNKYPTWIKSAEIVTLHASLVNQIAGQLSYKTSLLYWINSLSKLARPLGILSYQLPLITPQEDKFDTVLLYRFVKQHYKSIWAVLLLLCHIWYEKRFPLYAFAKAQFYKKRVLKLDVNELQKTLDTATVKNLNYDVVIPTMGRPKYLYDVLTDLAKQTVLPNRLVIIEQNADLNVATELSYLVEEDWPFQITHEFIHQTGACNARNLALSKTTALWVLLFDDDVRVTENFSSQVTKFLDDSKARCVTFACLQKGEQERLHTFKQWESFGSGCSIVHREIVERCKFDMALEHGYGEDVDYGMQIRQAGYDVIYAPQIQLLHLKAPVGGFRKPHLFPWQEDEVQPKPSPQIMYYRKKNYTHKQLLGYKMVQFFKTYGVFGTILPWKHYKKYQEAWNQSEKWASQL